MKKLLIFDVDLTLIDSNIPRCETWKFIAKHFNKDLNLDLSYYISLNKKYHGKWQEFAIKDFGFKESDLAEIEKVFFDNVEKCYIEHASWYDDMIYVINELQLRSYSIAIASNNTKDAFERFFIEERMNFPINDQISHNHAQKPQPDMINDHINNLNFSKENTYIIGDSLTDLKAGRNAGIKTVWAKYGSIEDEPNSYFYDHILESPKCLLDLFS